MKIKCTSKRRFKKILIKMIPYVLGDVVMFEIYASEIYKCGINTYKGMKITYVNKVWFHNNPHAIYITKNGMWTIPNNL